MGYPKRGNGRERVLRKSDAISPDGVSAETSMVVAATAFVLNQEGFYHSFGKPSYSGGFYLTVYDGDDKLKTYFAAHDEPCGVAEELLMDLSGAQAVKEFRRIFERLADRPASTVAESASGVADVKVERSKAQR